MNYEDEDDQLLAQEDAPEAVPSVEVAPDKDTAIKNYIMKQYAAANDDSKIKAAKDESHRKDTIANIASALEGLAKSTSMAHGGAGVDEGFYQGIKQQGQKGVQQAQDERQAKVQQLLQTNQMERQGNQDLMAKTEFDQKQKEAGYKNDANDGTSPTSQRAVVAARGVFKSFPGINNIIKDGMSAVEVENTLKGLEKKAGFDNAKDIKQLAVAQLGATTQNRQDAVDLHEARKQFEGLAKDLDSETATSRNGIGIANNKVNSASRLMTFADVNPDEIAAAKKDPKLRTELISKLDKLTPQQYSEVVSGLMSQLTNGGTGSLGQFEHLKANTASQTAANIRQYLDSNPAPAGMGNMIYNNLLTLKNEQDTSQAVIDKHNSKLKSKYPLAFTHPQTSNDAEKVVSDWSSPVKDSHGDSQSPLVGSNDTKIGISHPQANAALEWAKSNPNDPRATEILKRVGSANAGL